MMPDFMQKLAQLLGVKIAKKYRVPAETAAKAVLEHWSGRADLVTLMQTATSEKSITRTRLYKDAERDVTRKVYYQLRRYQASESSESMVQALLDADGASQDSARLALVQNHISTAERLPHLQEFWQALMPYCNQAQSILDVGCGLLPLLFPFDRFQLDRYMALDRSADSVNTIQAFKTRYNLQALQTSAWDIATGWDVLRNSQSQSLKSGEMYDVAFLFKLVPVVARQEPHSLQVLANTPAKKLLVTGCKTAMVKRQDISRREKASLQAFAADYQLQILDEFETPDEVGLVLAKPYSQ